MKRIMAILMVCLFMVAVMAVMAAPAFADKPNASGMVDDHKKIGALSNNPNDGHGPTR